MLERLLQVGRPVVGAEPAPRDEVGAGRDRGGRVELQERQPLDDLEQVGGSRRRAAARGPRSAAPPRARVDGPPRRVVRAGTQLAAAARPARYVAIVRMVLVVVGVVAVVLVAVLAFGSPFSKKDPVSRTQIEHAVGGSGRAWAGAGGALQPGDPSGRRSELRSSDADVRHLPRALQDEHAQRAQLRGDRQRRPRQHPVDPAGADALVGEHAEREPPRVPSRNTSVSHSRAARRRPRSRRCRRRAPGAGRRRRSAARRRRPRARTRRGPRPRRRTPGRRTSRSRAC